MDNTLRNPSESAVPVNPSTGHVEELTDEGLAAYIFDALVVFRQLSKTKNMDFLTYLLDMAAQEAHVLSGGEKGRTRISR